MVDLPVETISTAPNVTQPNRKLLSIATGVRNDNYVENYAWRVSTILNYMAYGLDRIGRLDDVEIMIADWNSPTPMANELPLSDAARSITRFFDVPAAVAVPAQRGSAFPFSVVPNAAMRRATGQYICVTDNDCLYTPTALDTLLRLLDGTLNPGLDLSQAFMPISRRQLAQELTFCFPSVEEIDFYLKHYGSLIAEDPLLNGIIGGAGAFVMHRDLWDACGGMDEREVHWGWQDLDLALRSTRRHPWFNLGTYGVGVFHMAHAPNWTKKPQTGKGQPKKAKVSTHQVHYPFAFNPNGADWGQGQHDLPVYAQPAPVTRDNFPPNSTAWRMKVLQPLTPADLREQLAQQKPDVTAFLQNAAGYPLPTTAYELAQRQDGGCESFAWGFLEALFWYSRTLKPLTYLDAGIARGLPVMAVIQSYPAVSVYGFEAWVPTDDPLALHPVSLTTLISRQQHHGYLRYISDPSLDGYQTFWTNPDVPAAIDLIFYGNPYPAERVWQETCLLLTHLAPGGCFIWHHPDRTVLDRVGAVLQQAFSGCCWVKGQGCYLALRLDAGPLRPEGAAAPLADPAPAPEAEPNFLSNVERVHTLLQNQQIDEAVMIMQALLAEQPRNADLYLMMGGILWDAQRANNTRYFYEQAVALDPNMLAGYLGLSRTLIEINSPDEAEATLRQYLQRFPNHPHVLKTLGNLLLDQGRYSEAFDIYCSVLTLKPHDLDVLVSTRLCAAELGDLLNEKMLLTKLIEILPNESQFAEALGQVDQRLGTAYTGIQTILASTDILSTFVDDPALLSADIIYLLYANANQLRSDGSPEMADGFMTLANSMQQIIDSQNEN